MPAFDPAWPPQNAEIVSAKFRDQFNSLNDKIDAVPAGPPGPQGAQGIQGPPGPMGLPVTVLSSGSQVPSGWSLFVANTNTASVSMPDPGFAQSLSLVQLVAINGGCAQLYDHSGNLLTDSYSCKIASVWSVEGNWYWAPIYQQV